MAAIRKGLAVLLAILVVLTALPAQVLFNLERKAFTAATYQQAFANDDFYARLPGLLARALAGSDQALPVNMQGLTVQDWESFFRDLLPSDILKTMGDQAVASTIAYLDGRDPAAVLSLSPLQQRLASEAGTRAVLGLMRTRPLCTLEEIARITLAVINGQSLSLCNPPEDLYPVVIPLIQGQMRVLASVIPAEVTLTRVDPQNGRPDPRQRIEVARLVMRLAPVMPLGLLLLLTVLIVRSLRDWLAWWGLPLLVSAGLALLTAWLGAPLARIILLQVMDRTLPEVLPQVFLASGSSLAAAIVDQFLLPTRVQGLFMLAFGVLFLTGSAALSFAARRRETY